MYLNRTSFKIILDSFSKALENEVKTSYLELPPCKKGPQELRFGNRKNLACCVFFGQTRSEIEQFFQKNPNGFIGVNFDVLEDGSLCILNRAFQQLRHVQLDSHSYLGKEVLVPLDPCQIQSIIYQTLCPIITKLDPFFALVEFESRLGSKIKVYGFGKWFADGDRIKNKNARSSGLRIENKNLAYTGHYTPVSSHHCLYQLSFFTPATHNLLREILHMLISEAQSNPIPLERKLNQAELAEMSCRFVVSKLGFLKDEFIDQIKDRFSECIDPPYYSVEAEALSYFESISIPMGITLLDECSLSSTAEWILSNLAQTRMPEYTFPACSTFGHNFCTNIKQYLDDSYDDDARCSLDSIMNYFEISFDHEILKTEEEFS
ncbi:hypothetical protein AB4562_22430 [Vibrio sp. 10N.222.54.A1]|jgi:hypothetical protein|uniref:hypothetical protein n=1 Tax=Vibrio TaxID=662 RepID=UPI0000671415|nr:MULTISPECIES: hypothetical protein [Vibrio]EAP94383.1 hypothetical protein V12B01_09381 [Vibrio splendidus 12B01]NOI96739.1 hypothetical protein [Vibrio sp. T3Y01]OEE14803.1 hypothetical protein OC1_12910 [Vibrio cyclitrophicus ZF207]PME47857.1 hypothetical protein BCV35_13800 [Vibrio cyclitrophicus]PMH27089.1 hypothetical protein BCU71_20455 [Vibrio lentus]